MPRKKKIEETQSVVEEVSVETSESQEVVESNPVYFEGGYVVDILDTNVPNFRHCKMSDGTTRHVPEELFK